MRICLGVLLAIGLMASPGVARAGLVTVDWTADSTPDGSATGTLLGNVVTLTSTNGSVNGGITTPTVPWASNPGTNDVPGIGDAGVINEFAAIDWNSGAAGFVTISFGGTLAVNPILLFSFADPQVETFDFADGLTLSILDQNPGGSVSIAAGNVVTTSGVHLDRAIDAFAVQLTGNFSSISFATNTNLLAARSLGFTVAIDDLTSVVPEPSTFVMSGACVLFAGVAALRRRRSAKSAA